MESRGSRLIGSGSTASLSDPCRSGCPDYESGDRARTGGVVSGIVSPEFGWTVIDPGFDDQSEAPAGSDAGHAWAICTVEPLADERADQEYTIRYDCYALPGGDASLVMTHVAPRSLWEAETSKADRLRAGIWLAEAARSGHVEIERAA